jgi:hypothetical protein
MSTDHRPASALAAKLRALPSHDVAPFTWAEFRRRTALRPSGGWRPSTGWQVLALAASVVALIFAVTFLRRDAPGIAERPALAEFPLAGSAAAQESEEWLAELPAEPAIVRVDTYAAVTALEDRIAWLDDSLSHESFAGAPPARLAELQRERVQLVDSLVRVRYADSLAAVAR